MPLLPDILNSAGHIATVSFLATVDPSSSVTLVSKRISRPFRLFLIRPHFALNCNRTLRLSFYIAPDDSAPTTKPITGSNVLSEFSQTDYVVGDDEYKELYQHFYSQSAGAYLKIHAQNTDSAAHTIDAQLFIELL